MRVSLPKVRRSDDDLRLRAGVHRRAKLGLAGAAGRNPRGAGGTRHSHRPSCRMRSPRECRWKERYGQLDRGARRICRRLGTVRARGEPRATHRRPKRRYKKRVRMPSKLDPHVALIEGWLGAEPQLIAIAIVRRLAELHPDQFGKKRIRSCSGCCEPCARAPQID